MGYAHHSLREHPIMFTFGEEVQIPLNHLYKRKRKDTLLGIFSYWLRRWDLNHTASGL